MENYICINGKKAELTEEQMKALGIELPKAKSPFDRVGLSKAYSCITGTGKVTKTYDLDDVNDRECYKVGNYCTDASLLEQRALHETLNRLLWRYSMEHDGNIIDWNDLETAKYYIYYDSDKKETRIDFNYSCYKYGTIHFVTKYIAKAAIKEIVEPFLKEHPEFKF